MAPNFVRVTLALCFTSIVGGVQLFAGEPSCAESCYSKAVSLNGCAAADLPCQCEPTTQAGIALAGGPCFLSNCAVSDLSAFSSAWTAACSAATATGAPSQSAAAAMGTTVASPAETTASSVKAMSTTDSTGSARGTIQLGAFQTTPSQEQTSQVMGDTQDTITIIPKNLGAAGITAIVVAVAMMVVGAGMLVYCCSVVRKRRVEKKQWHELEKERAAMQTSLDELKRAVSRQGTYDAATEKPKFRPKTYLVNWKAGPQELMVPEKVFHELPASPAAWEKM